MDKNYNMFIIRDILSLKLPIPLLGNYISKTDKTTAKISLLC